MIFSSRGRYPYHIGAVAGSLILGLVIVFDNGVAGAFARGVIDSDTGLNVVAINVELNTVAVILYGIRLDLNAAANAGMKSIFCRYGFGEKLDAVSTVEVDDFNQLINYILGEK